MLMTKGLISVVLWCVVKSELDHQHIETVMCPDYSCFDKFPECDCDPMCAVFGECCLDAKNVSVSARRPVQCSSDYLISVYLINACDDGYPTDAETKQKCSRNIPLHNNPDPYDSVPVTSVDTRITYRNVHCARCNGDTNVIYWNMDIKFGVNNGYIDIDRFEAYRKVNETFLANNLAYFDDERSWGIWLWINGRHEFAPVEITATEPTEVWPRSCVKPFNRIDSCPPNWPDRQIASNCELFLAVVESCDTCRPYYKNKFCALCHGVTEEELRCQGHKPIVPGKWAPFNAIVSFNTASFKIPCEIEGEHFDVFKKCKGTFENIEKNVEIV